MEVIKEFYTVLTIQKREFTKKIDQNENNISLQISTGSQYSASVCTPCPNRKKTSVECGST